MKSTRFAIFVFALAALAAGVSVSGCGGAVPSVSAAPAPGPMPPTPPPAPACVPDVSGVSCSAHVVTPWGYCHYETHQTARTFSVALEIGISITPADPNTSLCVVPLGAGGGDIATISGMVNYVPFTANLSSMVLLLRTDGTPEESLYTAKMAVRGVPVTVPFAAAYPGLHAGGFFVIFNDDLDAAKPTTISLGFAGTFK